MENKRMTYNNILIIEKKDDLSLKEWLITIFWSWLGYKY